MNNKIEKELDGLTYNQLTVQMKTKDNKSAMRIGELINEFGKYAFDLNISLGLKHFVGEGGEGEVLEDYTIIRDRIEINLNEVTDNEGEKVDLTPIEEDQIEEFFKERLIFDIIKDDIITY